MTDNTAELRRQAVVALANYMHAASVDIGIPVEVIPAITKSAIEYVIGADRAVWGVIELCKERGLVVERPKNGNQD